MASMSIDFGDAARSTLGLEWEVALVDPGTGALTGAAPDVLAALPKRDEQPMFTRELLTNTVELVTAPHDTVAGTVHDLRTLLGELQRAARAHGARVYAAGTHPTSRWQDQEVTAKERYEELIERTSSWGQKLVIWGVHTHIGIERVEAVWPTINALLAYQPHLLALSASSPYFEGLDSGYASQRTMLFQQLPGAGLPPEYETWPEFERGVEELIDSGIVGEVNELRWDVRPSPKWGTIEVRIMDSMASLADIAAGAALTVCLVEQLQRTLDRGGELPRLSRPVIAENKWRAARFGLDAEIIVHGGDTRRLRDDLAALVRMLRPISTELGCSAELERVLAIVKHGTGAERYRAEVTRAGGDVSAATRACVAEVDANDPDADDGERSKRRFVGP